MPNDGENAFEVGARYRTRVQIDALRDRFAAGEVLVYWRYGASRYHDARGWFFRQAATMDVRTYDLAGGEPLRRDELFERVSGPAPIVSAATADDAATIQGILARSPTGDADEILDREIAAERALILDCPTAAAALINLAAFDEETRIRLLIVAARHGRAEVLSAILATGIAPDAAPPNAQTALVAAVFGEHVDAINVLIAAGANPDLPQASGPTARAFARDPRIAALLRRPSPLPDSDAKG